MNLYWLNMLLGKLVLCLFIFQMLMIVFSVCYLYRERKNAKDDFESDIDSGYESDFESDFEDEKQKNE